MPKAKEVAAELRKLAESLEREPETEVHSAYVSFYCHEKAQFLNVARLMPRPLRKEVDESSPSYPRLRLRYEVANTIAIHASILQADTCILIRPAIAAVYQCDPILSLDEEEAISL